MPHRFQTRLDELAECLLASRTDIPLPLKMKTAEVILRLMAQKSHKHFGLFVILGWQRKWQDHLDISDSQQDIFAEHHLDIMRAGEKGRRLDVGATVDFDGAILIDKRGTIIHSGVFIEGLRPRVVAERVNPGRFKDLSEQFGFDTKVHARHLAAISASYVFKGTTVFTVSEETDTFHAFEGGKIMYHA
jgi:DNA integrity scanning protein DisA with diadenylate cyclase activity